MRRRRSRRWELAVALLAAVPRAAGAQGDASSGAAFLLLPVGARATGLGQAGVADGVSSEAVFWNPAGLAGLPATEFAVHYASTFASDNTALAIHFVSQRLGTLGFTGYLVDYGSQELLPPGGGLPGGRVAPKNVELLASYATDIGGTVALGLSYKLIQFRQDCQGDCGALGDVTGTTHAVDVGAQVVLGHGGALRVGVALQHVGFALQLQNREQADPLPTRLALGVAYRLPLGALGASHDLGARVLVDVQDTWGEYGRPDARMGAEVGYGNVLHLRAGYAFLQSETRGASVGVGIQLDRVVVDLARVFYAAGTFDEPIHLTLRIRL
jgi:hypothetical protein